MPYYESQHISNELIESIKKLDIDLLWKIYRDFSRRAVNITDINSEIAPDFLSWMEKVQKELNEGK